ncbi:hypothetical protein, partial [Bacteroides pyogenes]|uniref:hypothetical protein n=1 Tax=Bacteroides pyogenes TaxID=310300 RepID=UPI002A913220
IVFLAYIHGAKVHVFRLRHPNHPIILRNSLIIIVRYMMAQKSDEVRKIIRLPKQTKLSSVTLIRKSMAVSTIPLLTKTSI